MSDTFRVKYRELTEPEKQAVENIKTAAERLEELIKSSPYSPRCQALAMTKLEEAVMWAVKGLTG